MANGKTHTAATTTVLAVGTLLSIGFVLKTATAPALALAGGIWCGLVAGHLVTPDIDHRDTTIEEGRFLRFFGLLGWLWVGFWKPYRAIFRHRGWSHTVPIGTLSRVIYLAVPAGLLWITFGVPLTDAQTAYLPMIAFGMLIGWMFQDLVHLTLDGLLFHFLVPKH